MTDITFDIVPQRSALIEGHNTEIHALIRVRAPAMPERKAYRRSPLNLALVLDRSGSMHGKPLAEAKRCAEFIVDNLDEQDRLSLLAYDDTVDVLAASQPVTNKHLLKQAINSIYEKGCTALFDGWQKAARQARDADVGSEFISRVLLLSDGCANRGITSATEIAHYCAGMAEQGVSTSTYGLGHHFNEDLMVEMAKAGAGQSYYGESAEDLMDPFREEFSLLSATCARGLRLQLSVPEGIQLKVLNDYHRLAENTWQLRDLAYGGEVWVLLKLTVPADLEDPVRNPQGDLKILSSTLSYTDVNHDQSQTKIAHLHLPRVPAAAWQAIAEDTDVRARLQEIKVAQIEREAREAALREDWAQVDECLLMAEDTAGDNAWVKESLGSLKRYAKQRDSARMSKEARYSSQRKFSRMARLDENAACYSVDEEALVAPHLRKKREQGKGVDGPKAQ